MAEVKNKGGRPKGSVSKSTIEKQKREKRKQYQSTYRKKKADGTVVDGAGHVIISESREVHEGWKNGFAKYSTGEQIKSKCEEYLEFCSKRRLEELQRDEKPTPMTIEGLCNFMGVSRNCLNQYRHKPSLFIDDESPLEMVIDQMVDKIHIGGLKGEIPPSLTIFSVSSMSGNNYGNNANTLNININDNRNLSDEDLFNRLEQLKEMMPKYKETMIEAEYEVS